ncbi:PREDICTED: small integral membrane protein 12 isoform X1 [Poecilia mexicana]|uniref:small integral membrane protein 12 isoform X1 n=1 Tax=Poecilia mexicana TaxID=48701 RepID=UPI00072DE4B1|nr:PREDICTED: small integral membrane protein 12 isoform X1 [Poecilia mexicana]
MWPVVWTAMRTYAPYVTFPVAFVVGAVGYHLEWFIRGTPKPREEEKSILELREERKLQEQEPLESLRGGCSTATRTGLQLTQSNPFNIVQYPMLEQSSKNTTLTAPPRDAEWGPAEEPVDQSVAGNISVGERTLSEDETLLVVLAAAAAASPSSSALSDRRAVE